mmetsp:Transcript_24054/g.50006  ORF Transcript_24054/g.50006 Transcript_24054/m.50006 type:complete len:221 (-) Transcript_24054:172-834(-)
MDTKGSRPFVQVDDISTFTAFVLHAIWENSHLKFTFINNIEFVSMRPLLNYPVTRFHIDRFHARVDHLALLLSDISEHNRCLDSLFNAFLFSLGLGRSQFFKIELKFGFLCSSGSLSFELGNFFGFFFRHILSDGLQATARYNLILESIFVTFFLFIFVIFICKLFLQIFLKLLWVNAKVLFRRLKRGTTKRVTPTSRIIAQLINKHDNDGNIIGSKLVL